MASQKIEALFSEFGEVRNDATCIKILRSRITALCGCSDVDIIKLVNRKSRKLPVRFFNSSYEELDDSDCSGTIMWVNTGYTIKSIITKEDMPVWAQFTRSGSEWVGARIDTEQGILDSVVSDENKTKALVTKESHDTEKQVPIQNNDATEDFIKNLIPELLITDDWSSVPINLRSYFDSIVRKLNNKLLNGVDCSEWLILNKSHTKCIFSSGLFDKYGKEIHIMSNYISTANEVMYSELQYRKNFADSLALDFDEAELKRHIVRVPLIDNPSDLIFDANFEDFDLSCNERIAHCIEERIERFPKEYQNMPLEVLYNDLITQLKRGIEISKYDYFYVQPIFHRSHDRICFVIPYRMFGDFSNKRPLGIVVGRISKQSWGIMTIYTYDDVVRNCRALSPFRSKGF